MKKYKKCNMCGAIKHIDEFYKSKNGFHNGTQSYKIYPTCKECRKLKRREAYEKEKGKTNYIYRFINKNGEVIYIGKTNNISARIHNHLSDSGHLTKECYEQIDKIQFMITGSHILTDIKELYYINLYKPQFNYIHNHNSPAFIISDFVKDEWVDYNKDQVKKINYSDLNITLEDNIMKIKSLFKRNRSNSHTVYIEYLYKDGSSKQKRIKKFKEEQEAIKLIERLNEYFNYWRNE